MSIKHVNITDELRFFIKGLWEVLFKGGLIFYTWMIALTILVVIGVVTYSSQFIEGLVITNMREQVSWGFYISNFTFLVGVAAAAVLLVIPAYLYHFKAIKKIVAFGELLAVTAVLMALLFVFVDTGRPDRLWHAIPGIGYLNLPQSILGWDMIVLNGYFAINLIIVLYLGSSTYLGREPNKRFVIPLILLSIPWAVGLHTVTAFVYSGMAARPFWNASILAPRFLASAFCSGPSLMIIIFQILRKVMNFEIRDSAIHKLAEIISYAMAINLFLLVAEIYKEYYSNTIHLAPMAYLFTGLHGHNNLVPWIWTAMGFNIIGFLLFLYPKTRKNFITLNIGCVLLFVGIWIEKGMGLIIPGFIPDALGEIYEYAPSRKEILIGMGIWALGGMLYTLFSRAVIAIDTGRLRYRGAPPISLDEEEWLVAGDIMAKNVITVSPESSIEDIRVLLTSNKISGVPVVDEKNRVVGVVSDTDIVYNLLHLEPHLMDKLKDIVKPEGHHYEVDTGNNAAEIMSSPPITALANTPLTELITIITVEKIKRIIIVDNDMQPIGVVSKMDIAMAQSYEKVASSSEFRA
jgi:molybdopterin-containing oxidoreductase family membrane subunit